MARLGPALSVPALSVPALAAVLAEKAGAAEMAPELVQTTVGAALAYASGKTAAAGVVSVRAAGLTEGVFMMWYTKIKMVACCLCVVALVGTGIGYFVHQAWAAQDVGAVAQAQPQPAKAQQAAGAQGDIQKEIAGLRSDVLKLREELDAARRQIMELKDMLQARQAAAALPPGPLYRGKSVHFWLEQYEDTDVKFRAEAVKALGVLMHKDKKLIPVLVCCAQGPELQRQLSSSRCPGGGRAGARSPLLEIVKDKTAGNARSFTARCWARWGLRPSPRCPSWPTCWRSKIGGSASLPPWPCAVSARTPRPTCLHSSSWLACRWRRCCGSPRKKNQPSNSAGIRSRSACSGPYPTSIRPPASS